MARGSGPEQLAHSFTDLVTSLMVIFILLLVVFVNNQASVNVSATRALMAEIKDQLAASGFNPNGINLETRAPATIALSIPSERLNFQPGSYHVKPEGREFLLREMPKVVAVLCEEGFRDSVESIMIEGYADSTPFRGVPAGESEALNLRLSQHRSMEVARITLAALADRPTQRACLMEKLSVSGRGEQDPEKSPSQSRRVVFKIRLDPARGMALLERLRTAKLAPPPAPSVAVSPAVVKVLGLLDRLRATFPQPVSFHLTESEINEYLAFALRRTPRPGIESVTVKIFPHNYVSTFTVVDFDALNRWNPELIPIFLRPLLNGRKTIWLDYRFQIRNGRATFSIEKAYCGDVSLPPWFVRKLIQTVAALQPERIDTEQPFPLPFGLREVRTFEHAVAGHN